jgi:HAD superfamily hydrolase (TIGR01509 family)
MSKLRALIFDVDGTLAETERDGHRIAFNRAFRDAGLDWQWSIDLYGKLLAVSGGKERIRYYIDRYAENFQPPNHLPEWIAGLHRAKTQYVGELLAAGQIPLRPGVRRLLTEARKSGIRLAIATTSAPENAKALLKSTLGDDSLSWFDVIAAGDIVPAKKPAPDIYEYVLQTINLQPQDCLAIEDSPQGLAAAIAAGLKTVITVNDYTHHEDFSAATLVVNHLGEPTEPFTVIAGEAGDFSFFNLALAQTLISD